MILAIDFDSVIHDDKHPKPGMKMGLPLEGAKAAMMDLRLAGHTLIIHTVRGDRPKHVEDWMNYYGIPFDSVTNIKPAADVYLDDRGMKFTNWVDCLGRLQHTS